MKIFAPLIVFLLFGFSTIAQSSSFEISDLKVEKVNDTFSYLEINLKNISAQSSFLLVDKYIGSVIAAKKIYVIDSLSELNGMVSFCLGDCDGVPNTSYENKIKAIIPGKQEGYIVTSYISYAAECIKIKPRRKCMLKLILKYPLTKIKYVSIFYRYKTESKKEDCSFQNALQGSCTAKIADFKR